MRRFFMEDVTSSLIMKFVSEVGEIQNRLNELERIKVELEEELGLFKCMEESLVRSRLLLRNNDQ